MIWKKNVDVSAEDVVERFGWFEKAWGRVVFQNRSWKEQCRGDLKWCEGIK